MLESFWSCLRHREQSAPLLLVTVRPHPCAKVEQLSASREITQYDFELDKHDFFQIKGSTRYEPGLPIRSLCAHTFLFVALLSNDLYGILHALQF